MILEMLGGFGSGCGYISHGDVLNQSRIEVGPLAHFLEESIDHVLQSGVLEGTFPGPCEWGADCEGDDHVIGILGRAVDLC